MCSFRTELLERFQLNSGTVQLKCGPQVDQRAGAERGFFKGRGHVFLQGDKYLVNIDAHVFTFTSHSPKHLCRRVDEIKSSKTQ